MNIWSLLALAGFGYLLVMWTNPASVHLRDGWRCVCRYSIFWKLPAGLGLAYALFSIGLDGIMRWVTHDPGAVGIEAGISAAPVLLRETALPAFQRLSGIFGNIFPVFPLSVVAGWLLLANWRGSAGELRRALSKRWGSVGWVLFGAVMLCALAGGLQFMIYPILFYADRLGNPGAIFATCAVIDWLSSLFEWVLGAGIQVFLILKARTWVRGSSTDSFDLWKLAVSRMGFVLKWGVVVLLLNSVFLHLPVVLPHFVPAMPGLEGMMPFVDSTGSWVVSIVLVLFCSMQVTLTLHNDSLLVAFGEHLAFVRGSTNVIFWFLVIGGLHCVLLAFADQWVSVKLEGRTLLSCAWSLLLPLPWALLSGWLLASWVCLYKQQRAGEGSVAY